MPRITAVARALPRSASTGQFIQQRITPAVKAGVTAFANLVLEEAKAIVPVDTGELRDSGGVEVQETEKSVRALVVFTAEHSAYVEFGTGLRGSQSPGRGKGPYKLSWPGMPAQPYLRPAMDSAREAGLTLFRGQIAIALKP